MNNGLKDANNRYELNKNLAQMLKGGVIMDVTTPEQAKIAEAAGTIGSIWRAELMGQEGKSPSLLPIVLSLIDIGSFFSPIST